MKRQYDITAVFFFIVSLLFLSSCGQELLDPTFSGDQLQPDSFQLRFSARGLDRMGTVMESQMPQDPQAHEIPPQCDVQVGTPPFTVSLDICGTGNANSCTPEDPPCSLGTKIESFHLTAANDAINMVFDTTIWTDSPLTIHTTLTNCTVTIDTTQGAHPYVPVTVPIAMYIDGISDRNVFTVQQVQVDPDTIDDEDILIDGSATCKAVEYLFEGFIVDAVTSMISNQMTEQIQASLCRPCDQGCPHDSRCNEDSGLCEEDSGSGCVSMFGGESSLGSMTMDGPSMESHHWAGGYEDTQTSGLSLGFDAAFRASYREGCAPRKDMPDQVFTPYSPTLSREQSPFGSDYDAAMALTVPYMKSMGYAMYTAGYLCWDLAEMARGQSSFDTGSLAAFIPSISELMHGQTSPVDITFTPQELPEFTFGQGAWHMEGDKVVVDSPHILMTVPDMALDFWIWLDGAKVRLVRYLVDMHMPIVLIPEGDSVHMITGGMEFDNRRVTDSAMLKESDTTLLGVLNFMAAAMGGQSMDMGSFPMPEMMGFRFRIKEDGIMPVDDASYLAIFMDIDSTDTGSSTDASVMGLWGLGGPASTQSVPWLMLLVIMLAAYLSQGDNKMRAKRNILNLLIFFTTISLFACSFDPSGIKGGDCGGPAPVKCASPEPQCVEGQKKVILEDPKWLAGCIPSTVQCACVPDSSPLEPGEIGWYPAIATDGSSVLVIAREEKFDDLVHAWVSADSADSTPQWSVLDGAPSEPVIAPPDTYRGGVAAQGQDAGYAASAAFHGGRFYVAHATSDGHVYVLWTDGSRKWHKSLVARLGNVRVLYTAIGAYDSAKSTWPRIAWTVLEPGSQGRVVIARATDATPQDDSDFVVTVLDTEDTTDLGTSGIPPVPGIHLKSAGRGFLGYHQGRRQLVYYEPGLERPVYVTHRGSGDGEFFDTCAGPDGTLHIYYKGRRGVWLRDMSADMHISDAILVDDGIRSDGRHVIGNFLSVICDPLMIYYQDGSIRKTVRLRKVSGAWARKTFPSRGHGDGFDLDTVLAGRHVFRLNHAVVKGRFYWNLFLDSEELTQ